MNLFYVQDTISYLAISSYIRQKSHVQALKIPYISLIPQTIPSPCNFSLQYLYQRSPLHELAEKSIYAG